MLEMRGTRCSIVSEQVFVLISLLKNWEYEEEDERKRQHEKTFTRKKKLHLSSPQRKKNYVLKSTKVQ